MARTKLNVKCIKTFTNHPTTISGSVNRIGVNKISVNRISVNRIGVSIPLVIQFIEQ